MVTQLWEQKNKLSKLEAICLPSSLHIQVKEKPNMTTRHHKTCWRRFESCRHLRWKNPETNVSQGGCVVRIQVTWIFCAGPSWPPCLMWRIAGGAITAPTGRLALWPLKHLCVSVLTGSTSIRGGAVCSSQGAIRIYVKQETLAELAD